MFVGSGDVARRDPAEEAQRRKLECAGLTGALSGIFASGGVIPPGRFDGFFDGGSYVEAGGDDGAAAAMMLFGAAARAQTTQWDMPTPFPAGNYQTENVRHFVSEIEKATQGRLKITVHDSGSLFKGNEIKRAVQGGQAEIGEIIISGYSNEDPMYGVDSIPFLATDYESSKKLWQASRPAIEARFARQGMKVLYAVPWPPQGIFSAKPIDSLADLKGVKWRAYNPNTSRIAQLIGAQISTGKSPCKEVITKANGLTSSTSIEFWQSKIKKQIIDLKN